MTIDDIFAMSQGKLLNKKSQLQILKKSFAIGSLFL